MNITIVLVDPIESMNIGSVCRAMKTMNLKDLVIIGNKEDYEDDKIRQTSVSCYDIYQNTTFTNSLSSLLENYELSIATSRRLGKKRKNFSFNPNQLKTFLNSNTYTNIAIVFGRESTGLSDTELNMCNALLTIPTSDNYPSLNLSQAVQIVAYELFTYQNDNKPRYTPISVLEAKETSIELVNSLEELNIFKNNEKNELTSFFTDIFSRSSLSSFESNRIKKLFNKVKNIYKYKEKNL